MSGRFKTNFIGVALLLLAGCVENASADTPPLQKFARLLGHAGASDIYRFHDQATGAVCYVVDRHNGGAAITCLTSSHVRDRFSNDWSAREPR